MTPAPDLTALADKLDELAMKATPDAWYVSGSGDRIMCYDERVDRGNEIGWLFNSVQSNGSVSYGAEKDNAALIVALRNALPQITTALREAAMKREVEAERDRMAERAAVGEQLLYEGIDAVGSAAKFVSGENKTMNGVDKWLKAVADFDPLGPKLNPARAALKQEESRG